jgi:hypothetical protein
VSVQKPYGFRTDILNKKEEYKNIFSKNNTGYLMYAVEGHKGGAKRKTV